jgi:hypothetical protein
MTTHIIKVAWELHILDSHVDKLCEIAEERGLGDRLEVSKRDLIRRLMLDGGSDTIETALCDSANVMYYDISSRVK